MQEHAVEHLPGGGGQPEADVGHAQGGEAAWDLRLDAFDGVERRHPVAAQLLLPRPQREGQGVEDQVGRFQAELADPDVGQARAHLDLPICGAGLPLLIDGQGDQGGTVAFGQREQHVGLPAPVLQVHAVDDAAAAQALEGRLDDVELGGVHHQRKGGLGGQLVDQGDHVGDSVAADVVHADVQAVGPLARLRLGDGQHLVHVLGQQVVAEQPRAVGVEALADDVEGQLLLDRDAGVQGCQGRGPFDVTWGRRQVPDGRDHGGQVLRGGAAAAADDLHAQISDELVVRGGQGVGGQRVAGLSVDHLRDAGVRDDRDGLAAVPRQMAHVLAHVLRARGAVHADDVDAQRVKGRDGRTDLAAQQHRVDALLDGDRDHDRHRDALGGHPVVAGRDGGLGLQQVEDGLDQQHVGPT